MNLTELLFIILGVLGIVFLHDIIQQKHAILKNFPVIGHLRYLLEKAGPELRQYWVANDKEEMPFTRAERSWVYATSKKENNNFGFGSTEIMYETGYPVLKHAAFPVKEMQKESNIDTKSLPCAKLIGASHNRKKPYRPNSIVNISAMSFGSLGRKAVSSLNQGAKTAQCYHNTGEGGISPYHDYGADLIWQIGTGYFGARDTAGNFNAEEFEKTLAAHPTVKMIEIKLSQGAKPGKGGILPQDKITEEISKIRGIPQDKDCISPNSHSEFNNIPEMVQFIEKLADISNLPIGIKSAVGGTSFWEELAAHMKESGQGPDFITLDGGEGGTGAAPLAFADHVSLPFKIGFKRVYKIFKNHNLINDITWIGSAKLGFPDRAVVAFAMGCDLINIARESMLSIGCIQAQKCHTGHCPTGVATHNTWLQRGIHIDSKAERAANYIIGLRKEIMQLTHACGYMHPCQFTGNDIEISSGINAFDPLEKVMGYEKVSIPKDELENLVN
ncbi:MAG: FMN-binding glutamate synthase family protein [Candidatus Marinimicrobia bacterium]|nr:FMN-binding glutamate synthase family protein [Candidatus Neomarinimicrobiota bacterium]MDP6937119.1 FMN-binding glutamate synthase family protein [Candidatus Neomarinimicrobiota bacterium]